MSMSSPASSPGLTLVLTLPPNIANARWAHWAPKVKDKRRYWDELTLRMQARLIPRPPEYWPAFARVEMVFYVWARMDRDGLFARAKWPLDWLTGHGYIAGDSEKQIDLQVTQQIDRRHQRIQVTITPVSAVKEEAP